ncbi:hypothetical protein LOAG_15731, partial [Loa loa]
HASYNYKLFIDRSFIFFKKTFQSLSLSSLKRKNHHRYPRNPKLSSTSSSSSSSSSSS